MVLAEKRGFFRKFGFNKNLYICACERKKQGQRLLQKGWYFMFKVFETTLAGRPLVVETGKMAQLANGSCLVRYGDTVVIAAATASAKPREGVDFFPLSVDYEEKLYSVGKIPGSFIKREDADNSRSQELQKAL